MRSDRAITGTMVADLVRCEQVVGHDFGTDPSVADQVGDFVRLLWAEGCHHECEVLTSIDGLVDLRQVPIDERAAATVRAMAGPADWIAGARLELGDRVGMPDLMRRVDGVWYAGDVKGGATRVPGGLYYRREYAAQVAFYGSLLADLDIGSGDRAFVIDAAGDLDWYDLSQPIGRGAPAVREWVAGLTAHARAIRDGEAATRPALVAACGICRWRTACAAVIEAADDLTRIPGLGRALRDVIEPLAPTVAALSDIDLASVPHRGGASPLPGLGAERLAKFQARAAALTEPGSVPYATCDLALARAGDERHLDIETDPTAGGFAYLHGVYWIRDGQAPRYLSFFAEHPGEERDAFAAAIDFLSENGDALITTYSAFEKTTYRMLQRRYPEVVGAERIEALFDRPRTIDLYFDAVLPHTVWPLTSYGLKKIARHLGFDWRDHDAGGAASIAWFAEYCATRDPAIRRRIERYNEDDCRANAVVLEGLIGLPVRPGRRSQAVSRRRPARPD